MTSNPTDTCLNIVLTHY